MTNDPGHGEHFESVPWDALVTDDAQRRRRWLALMGGGVLVAGAAFLVTAAVGGGPSPTVLPVPSSAPTTTTTTSVATSTSLPTERELMAESGDDAESGELADDGGAAAFAAWFVADYFTADGTEVPRLAVEERLPEGAELPAAAPGARSFVESALPIEVVPDGDDRYRVVVVVRYLVATDGEAYRRPAALAAQVVVEGTEDGWGIVDLPSPVALPGPVTLELDVEPAADIPAHIADAAIAEAATWGFPTGELSAGRVGASWRVVAVVEDPAGLQLPVAIWLDEDGARL